MKKNFVILGTAAVLMLSTSYFYFSKSSSQDAIADEVVIFQSRSCGCCKKWAGHLEQYGYKVRSEFVDDVNAVKKKYDVPGKLASCHTAIVNGYVVEGHVPAEAIKKLLSERPSIKGIAVPGMPMGSPGMEGHYQESYDVLAFKPNGEQSKFMSF